MGFQPRVVANLAQELVDGLASGLEVGLGLVRAFASRSLAAPSRTAATARLMVATRSVAAETAASVRWRPSQSRLRRRAQGSE